MRWGGLPGASRPSHSPHCRFNGKAGRAAGGGLHSWGLCPEINGI